jgi:hypothetical protein
MGKETEEEEEERRREEMIRQPDFIYEFIKQIPQDKREEFYKKISQKEQEQ